MLHGPGGVDRFFTKNPNGTYTGWIGDHGVLALAGGLYRLVETDQTVWQFRTDGRLDFVQDTNGNRVTLGYTGGLLTSLTHSSGEQLLLAYNAAGRLVSVTELIMISANATISSAQSTFCSRRRSTRTTSQRTPPRRSSPGRSH